MEAYGVQYAHSLDMGGNCALICGEVELDLVVQLPVLRGSHENH